MVGGQVVGDVGEDPAAGVLGADEVGVLDQADEGIAAVGHVDPEVLGERALELEHEVERREVLDPIEPAQVLGADLPGELGVEQLREDVVGHAADDRVVGDRRTVGLERARVEAAAKRVRRAGDDGEAVGAALQPRRGAIDQHAAAAGLDPPRELGEQRLEAARRPDEPLLARLAVAEAAALADLVPDPGHRDLLGPLAELAAHERAPDLLPGRLAHVAADPRARGLALVGRQPAAAELQPQQRQAHAQPVGDRERPEAEQVADPVEGPDPPFDRKRGARRVAHEQVAEPELLERIDRDRVAREQVVVVALDPQPVAELHRRRLARRAPASARTRRTRRRPRRAAARRQGPRPRRRSPPRGPSEHEPAVARRAPQGADGRREVGGHVPRARRAGRRRSAGSASPGRGRRGGRAARRCADGG